MSALLAMRDRLALMARRCARAARKSLDPPVSKSRSQFSQNRLEGIPQ